MSRYRRLRGEIGLLAPAIIVANARTGDIVQLGCDGAARRQVLIEHFSEALGVGEPERLTALMAEDIVFYASIPSKPFVGRDAVVFVFRMLQEVCEEIEYVAQYGDSRGGTSSRREVGCKGGSSMAPRFSD